MVNDLKLPAATHFGKNEEESHGHGRLQAPDWNPDPQI